MHRPKSPRTLRRFLSFAATLALAASCTVECAQAQSSDEDGGPVFIDSTPPVGPAMLGLNSLEVTVTAVGYAPVEFAVSPIELPGYPGWLGVTSSPFGPLVFVPLPQVGDYLLGFLQYGITLPLQWDASDCTFDGTNGTVIASIVATPVVDTGGTDTTPGPGGGGGPSVQICVTEVDRPDGEKGVRIAVEAPAECTVSFKQFVSTKVSWSGAAGGGGVCGFPMKATGNNGKPQICDGRHVYVDSDVPSGDYPAQPPVPNPNDPGQSTTAMEDGPNLENLDLLEATIETDPLFPPGDDVTSITVEFRYTTYVYLTCPPAAAALVGRVEWWYRRTYVRPPAYGPDAPGMPGGPNPPSGGGCGFPLGTPTVNTGSPFVSADHAAALTGYLGGTYGGSQTPPW